MNLPSPLSHSSSRPHLLTAFPPRPKPKQGALLGARAALASKVREATALLAATPLGASTDAAGLERVRALTALLSELVAAVEAVGRAAGA